MEFNPGKCQVIHITRSKRSRYFMYNQELEYVDGRCSEVSGCDNQQGPELEHPHKQYYQYCSQNTRFCQRNVITKNKDIKTMAYKSLVRPQVEYAPAVWSPYIKEKINKIEKVQRRAARWVLNDYSSYSSVTDMLSNLGWRSLENTPTNTRLAMFYKTVYSLVAIPLPSYFEHPDVYTCHIHDLSYRQIRTSVCYYKYSFFPYPLFFGTSYQLISSWFLILTP